MPRPLITDIIAPEQEGMETITNLRKRQPGPPVIAMTGGVAELIPPAH